MSTTSPTGSRWQIRGKSLHLCRNRFEKMPLALVTPMTQLLGVALTGTGSCLPNRVVPNEEFAESLNLDTSDEWIRTRTGIRARRFAGVGESSATLGTAAAVNALASARLTPEDI